MTDRLLMLLGAGCYALAVGLALAFLARRRNPPRPVLLSFAAVGFALQTVGLYLRGVGHQSCPISNPFEVLQFIGWSILVVYWATGSLFRLSLLGTASATLAMLLTVVSLLVPGWDDQGGQPVFGGDPWVEAHASLALFSYGVFGLLAATSTLYLLQHGSLKRKMLPGVFRFFPPISELDLVNLRLLVLGVAVFSVAAVIGSLYWLQHFGAVGWFKLAATHGLWALGILVLVLRLRAVLVGTRLAWACLALFGAALLSLWPVEEDRPAPPPTLQALWR